MKKIAFLASAIGLITLSCSATEITLQGSQLQSSSGVTYSTSGGVSPVGNPQVFVLPTATYQSASGGYADLYTPDGTINGPDVAMVSVKNGFDGVSLGNLNSLLTAGAAGLVSFDLLNMPIYSGQVPFWQVTVIDPNSGTPMTFYTFNATPDKTNATPAYITGANYFNMNQSGVNGNGSTSGNNNALGFNNTAWSTIAGDSFDGSKIGTWAVASVGVALGGTLTTAQEEAQIGGFTLPGLVAAPDATSTLSLLGVCFGAMAGMRRYLHRI
jgi:hypothetical protein